MNKGAFAVGQSVKWPHPKPHIGCKCKLYIDSVDCKCYPDPVSLLERLANEEPAWNLAQLVDLANPLLPKVFPGAIRGKTSEGVNARLVRYYTSLGLMDEPAKDGREARYGGRHLLQLLTIKRLLAEGISTMGIGERLRQSSTEQLIAMLEKGVEMTPSGTPNVAPNPALEYAQSLRRDQGVVSRLFGVAPQQGHLPSSPYTSNKSPKYQAKKLHAIEVRPGLSLLIEDGFRQPKTPSELEALLKDITEALEVYRTPSSRKP